MWMVSWKEFWSIRPDVIALTVSLPVCVVDHTSASYRPKPVAFRDRCLAKGEWKHTRMKQTVQMRFNVRI